MPWSRPSNIFIKKGNQVHLSLEYKAYLSDRLKMKSDERKDWKNLGVKLTRPREQRLTGFFDAVDFLERQ